MHRKRRRVSGTVRNSGPRFQFRLYPAGGGGAQALSLCSLAMPSRTSFRAFSPANLAAFSDLKPLVQILTPSGLGRLLISHCHWGGFPPRVIETKYSFKSLMPPSSGLILGF